MKYFKRLIIINKDVVEIYNSIRQKTIKNPCARVFDGRLRCNIYKYVTKYHSDIYNSFECINS